MRAPSKNEQEVIKYVTKTKEIPKDWMERLAYLVKEHGITKKHLENALKALERYNQAEWGVINYTFYMDPKSTPRPRQGRSGVFYVKGAKDNKQLFDEFKETHSNLHRVISTPCILNCKAYFETPKGMSKEEKLLAEFELIAHTSKPDWDNIGKPYCDMIQNTLILDDCIVTKGTVEKLYSIHPRVEIEILYLKAYDSNYNKKKVESWKTFKEHPLVVHDIPTIL